MSNDPFARHGIKHLSPSSLNMWRNSPGIWTLKYLLRLDDGGSPAMWRGSAVEAGLAALLRGISAPEAIKIARDHFDQEAAGEVRDDIAAERVIIEPTLAQCGHWMPMAPGPLNASQLKVEHWIHDAISVPVIGYLDFGFDGIDVDLKTTKAMPSAARPDHVRQVSLYRVARNRRGALLYVTPKKFAQYDVDDAAMNSALAGLRADALSLSRFLASHADAESAVRSLPMDTAHYAYPTGATLPAYLSATI
jgi:hypothetical protein